MKLGLSPNRLGIECGSWDILDNEYHFIIECQLFQRHIDICILRALVIQRFRLNLFNFGNTLTTSTFKFHQLYKDDKITVYQNLAVYVYKLLQRKTAFENT